MIYSKRAALVSPQRNTELIGFRRVIKNETGNKSHTSITFIQHSMKRHSPFHPAGSLQNATIVRLSDRCTIRIYQNHSGCQLSVARCTDLSVQIRIFDTIRNFKKYKFSPFSYGFFIFFISFHYFSW